MISMAIYLFLYPPGKFGDSIVHRIAIPFLFMAAALSYLESMRTRAHIGQLVGAIRTLMGRAGKEPAPEVKGQAVEILLQSLRSGEANVRKMVVQQLESLTGQSLGDDPDRWEAWWKENRRRFGQSS
jgi:hypothetical protein